MPVKFNIPEEKVPLVLGDDYGPEGQTVPGITDELVVEYKELKSLIDMKEEDPIYAKFAAAKKALQKAVNDAFEDFQPDYEYEYIIGDNILKVGKKGTTRKITDMDKVAAMLGPETFMAVANVSMKSIDDYLTPEEREKVLTVTRSTRTFKVT